MDHEIDPQQLMKEMDRIAALREREVRAKRRLSAAPKQAWYFGIAGIRSAPPSPLNEFMQINPVTDPPAVVELMRALRNPGQYRAIARYPEWIDYELVVQPSQLDERQTFDMARWTIALLRVRTDGEMLVPIAADCSWSAIPGVTDKSCTARLVEDVPHILPIKSPVDIDESDIVWVADNLMPFTVLLEDARFATAVDALCSYHYMPSLRMRIACLWAGIEGLFGFDSGEVTYRLASTIAVCLGGDESSRVQLYRDVKKLYRVRSAMVHGKTGDKHLSQTALASHTAEVRPILSRLLSGFIESRYLPTREEFETAALHVQVPSRQSAQPTG